MKCAQFLTVVLHFHYASSQYVAANHNQPKSPCENSTKNSLIEHFFNIIFSEFQSTPPVCVCVQMCAGQSTYCYPNGCLKRDDLKMVERPQQDSLASPDKKQYMFVVDEINDFTKELLEKVYVDESQMAVPEDLREDMRPDIFKDSMLVKYKKMPNVQLRYNLREQVKNKKSDLLKIETLDLSKTRWPMNKHNLVSGHKIYSKLNKKAPIVSKMNFDSMLPANDYAEYPPKFFKRDLKKSLDDKEENVKAFYLFDNSETANETAISLETLIDNLIKNSFIKTDAAKNDTENKTKATERTRNILNTTTTVDENNYFSKEKVDNNKYADVYLNSSINMNNTIDNTAITSQKHDNTDNVGISGLNKYNDMIIQLSKRIEKQNNTSMEIAKQFVGDFDEENTLEIKTVTLKKNESYADSDSIIIQHGVNETETTNQGTKSTTSADEETMVTKKNRQRITKKLQNIKSN